MYSQTYNHWHTRPLHPPSPPQPHPIRVPEQSPHTPWSHDMFFDQDLPVVFFRFACARAARRAAVAGMSFNPRKLWIGNIVPFGVDSETLHAFLSRLPLDGYSDCHVFARRGSTVNYPLDQSAFVNFRTCAGAEGCTSSNYYSINTTINI